MGQNLIQASGGGPQKQTRFASIYTSRFLIGLYTNRNPLRGPLDAIYSEYYHLGTTDAGIDGLNTELSVRQTIIRRPGNTKYCTAQTAAAIDSFYSFHHSDGTIQVIADSATDVEAVTPTSITSLFTKTAGAGEAFFQGVDKSLYIADGIDTVKYIPGVLNPNTNTDIWNWGGVAPTVPPTLTVVESGSTATSWQASTRFSTMGLLVDSNGNIQQLKAISNGTQFGTASAGQPSWNQATNGTTSDNGVSWTNIGPLGVWAPNTNYANQSAPGTGGASSCIYDQVTGTLYSMFRSGNQSGVSGSSRPNFTGVVGSFIRGDGTCDWYCRGNVAFTSGGIGGWPAATSVLAPPNEKFIVEPILLPTAAGAPLPTQPIYVQINTNSGTTSSSTSQPSWATAFGATTQDNQLLWINLGSATWQAGHAYTAWSSSSNYGFNVIKDANGSFQVCIQGGTSSGSAPFTVWQALHVYAVGERTVDTNSNIQEVAAAGTSGASAPSWASAKGSNTTDSGVTWTNRGSAYGVTTTDNTVRWVNVGKNNSWTASRIWYLPSGGFNAPSGYNAFGSSVISDGTNIEFIVQSGTSGSVAPTWATTQSSETVDSAAVWYNNGAPPSHSFSWTSGIGYVYAYKARKATDVYVLTPPPMWPNPLGAPTGCADGTVTTASPLTQIQGSNAGAQVTVSGPGSTDPQFDTVSIFRSADGFGASGPYLFLTDIPMPEVKNGVAGTWTLVDYMPDQPTSTLPGLNPLFEAPVDHVNDPPPGSYGSLQFQATSANSPTVPATGTAIEGIVYHQGRLWGFIGNTVFASGGPDTNPGNGFTAWPPDQAFPFESNVTRMLSTTAGLLVFTTTDLEFIGGGPAIADYYSQRLIPGIGLLSWNALTLVAGIPHLFTSDRQLLSVDPSGGITRIGHNIGDKLAQYDPAQVYLTYHSYGDLDHALFISNGSTEWYRVDLNMAPDGKLTGPVWSAKATISGGFQAIASVETSPGTRKLLIGPAAAGYILARDSTFATFTDNGSAYSSYFTMGNIVLANAGQMCECSFIEMDFIQTGSQPTVSVLFDEISETNGAAFEVISNSFVSDPPKLYGPTATPKTMWADRYYFGQTTPGNTGGVPAPAWCKSLQLKVNFGTDTVQNELMAFSIFGALYQEK